MSVRINDYKTASNFDETLKKLDLKNLDNMPSQTDVYFGTFVNRISRISMKDSSFDADFYIWFKWKGENVTPGEDLQIVNGQVNSKQLQAESHEGDDHYEQYQITASITKPFNMMLFPFDYHALTIEIEDSLNSIYELQYIPENSKDVQISPEIDIPGYSVESLVPLSELHRYPTNFGSPWEETSPSIYSRIVFGIEIARDGLGIFFKLFQSLFIAVAVAMLAFFMKPDYAPRFVVGVGALFAAIANYYNILSMQPVVGYLTLADSINLIGISTILLSLIQSSISLHMFDNQGEKKLSRKFDKYSAITFVTCYIFINWWIVEIAMRN